MRPKSNWLDGELHLTPSTSGMIDIKSSREIRKLGYKHIRKLSILSGYLDDPQSKVLSNKLGL
jgi:hypothetical protein